MRRADRLFLLVQALRGRRLAVTGQALADRLGVSLRTLYRDIADLQRHGLPIEGAAGVGYRLGDAHATPALMFQPAELEALVVGARMVRAFAQPGLAEAAADAIRRIEAVLPPGLREDARRSTTLAPRTARFDGERAHLAVLQEAIERGLPVALEYADASGGASERIVEPLCTAFWGHAWTLGAWCRLRADYRDFRLDRIRRLALSPDLPATRTGTLRGYLARQGDPPGLDALHET